MMTTPSSEVDSAPSPMQETSMEQESSPPSPRGRASLDSTEAMVLSPPAMLLTPDETLNKKETSGKIADYKLPKCTMPSPSELQPVEAFVMNAIQSKHNEAPDPSHTQGYKAIIDALRRPVDPPMLRMVLISLRTAGSGTALNLLTTHASTHAQLIHWVFRFNATIRPNIPHDEKNENLCGVVYDGSLLDAHLHLILAMVSARTVNLIPALTAVWRMLAEIVDLEDIFQQRLHAMLCTMMRLVPKARTDLFPIIASRFPFWKAEKRILKWYCIQSLRVLDYLPSIRKFLLELIIDKCLEIDVNIKIDENGEVSIEEETKEKDTEKKTKGKVEEEESPAQKDAVGENVDILSDTLDSLLALLLNTLTEESKDGQGARDLYYELLPVFESTIITTHKSKFVQYCVFLLCGLESETFASSVDSPLNQQHSILHRDFAAKLLELIVDPYRATLTRQSAACYLASFVSRASYVESETICEAVSSLLRWAEAYMDSLASNSIRAADSREQSELHSLFYTVCQAAFYIMCFRGTEAVAFYREASAHYGQKESNEAEDQTLHPDPNDINLGTSRWTNICNHQLQPLRFCLESVRSEFLHVAHAFELIEELVLDKLVEDAKRMSTGRVNKKAASTIMTAATLENHRRKGGVGGLGRGSNPLKSFFPFDPLLLRRSHAFIEPFYKHWQGPVEEEDVLVIDEIREGNDQVFEMDEDGHDAEDSDDEEDAPVVVSDQETKNDNSDSDSDEDTSSHAVVKKRQAQKEAWAATLKRPRSQSLENGSW